MTTPIIIPESFRHRPYARTHYQRIAAWAQARHPFYQKHAPPPGEPFPVLTRADVQADNELLLNGHPVTGKTSGSTSTPIQTSWSEHRSRVDIRDTREFVRWLGGSLPNMRIISLAAHDKNAKTIDVVTPLPEQVEFLQRRHRADGACSLITYPTNLEMLCRYMIERGLRMPFMRRVTAMSEVYEPYHDELVREVFPNAVAAVTYSSVEAGLIAARCPHRPENYHVMAHKLGVEFLNQEGRPCAPGEVGQVVVTDFVNQNSTLIRYALGDLAAPAVCDCGRIDLPAMTNIIGKVRGVLKDASGRYVIFTNLSPMFRDSPEIGQFQVEQSAIGRFLVRFVQRPGSDLAPFQERVRQRFVEEFGAEADVAFEQLAEIPRSAGGKYHAAICRV